MEYAELQIIYKKDRGKAFRRILRSSSVSQRLTSKDVFQFWEHLTRTPFVEGELPSNDEKVNIEEAHKLTTFVTVEKVASAYPPLKTAVGVDNIDTRFLKQKFPQRVLAKIFTLWFRMCWVPQYVLDSRTIFIPKALNVERPEDLRPISISSVLLRHFHRILNNRLLSVVKISDHQHGFQNQDGIARAIGKIVWLVL